ncbi:MAG: hypothetical protein ACK4FB_07960 [Brevundimonas sp.]|uniref:hypothetical protein n=1 Tax=Brevundimonas sp. TaxID=1871086 RepID=UPI00391A827B
MQLKTVKTAADLPYAGVELVTVDKTVTEVIIGKMRVRAGQYTGLAVVVETPGDAVKRHRVTAVLEDFGTKVEHYEHSFEADSAVSKLERLGATVTRDEVTVLVNELGAVVGDAPAPSATTAPEYEPLPF